MRVGEVNSLVISCFDTRGGWKNNILVETVSEVACIAQENSREFSFVIEMSWQTNLERKVTNSTENKTLSACSDIRNAVETSDRTDYCMDTYSSGIEHQAVSPMLLACRSNGEDDLSTG